MRLTEPAYRPLDLGAFAIKDERVRVLLRHWLRQRGDGFAPARTAIDDTALGPALPSIWIGDFLPADGRFRIRTAGEELHRRYGRNIAGCGFEDFMEPGVLVEAVRVCRRVIEEPAVLYCVGQILLTTGRSIDGERLVLPLLNETGAPLHVIGASVFPLAPSAAGGPLLDDSMIDIFIPLADGDTRARQDGAG